MDIVTLGAALNGSAEYVNSHFKGGSNIQIVDNPDGTQTINASGEVSSEDTVARADIAAIKDGETLDSFGDVETALATKANTSTTYTKTEVDTALDNKVDKVSGKGLSTNDYTTAEKTKLAGIAEGAEVNEIEGIKVNSSTVNPDVNKVVNITVPTTAVDVSALPDTTKYAAALSLTINSSTYVITGQLKDQNGDNLGTAQTIDLPLESVVVGGSYNSQTKKVVLTLQNGNTIEFSVADLVSGLQTELSASNKLNPAYIDYDSTHRAVSDTEKSTWNGKQNAIDNSHKLSADLVDDTNATNKFATAEELEQIQTNKNNISKDEAALVELVDGGAKNIFIVGFASKAATSALPAITNNSDGTVTANGVRTSSESGIWLNDMQENVNSTIDTRHTLPAGKYALAPTGNIKIAIAIYKHDGVNSVNMGSASVNPLIFTYSAADKTQYPYLTYRLICGGNADFDNYTFKPMICTKSAWDISQAYVPYRPSYQELYEMVKALQANQ